MKDLIEALTILMKYGDSQFPIHCEHDVLIMSGIGVEENAVSVDDAKRLYELGFDWNIEYDCWVSYRFGS